jgi:hypothetical protein
MILLKKNFWVLIIRLVKVLSLEVAFCIMFIIIAFVVYNTTEAESLNSYTAAIFYKTFLSIPPCIYNAKQLMDAYWKKDYYRAIGFMGITALYCLFVWTLGGGGR